MPTSKILAELLPAPSDTVLMYYNLTGDGAQGNLFFVNQSSASDKVRVAITPVDVLPNPNSYLLYDTVVPPNHTVVLQEIALAQFERLYVFSENGTTSFVYTGLEYQPAPTGPTGPTGATGPTGPTGANGSSNTWLSLGFNASLNSNEFYSLAQPVLNSNYNTVQFAWPFATGYVRVNDIGGTSAQRWADVGNIAPAWENLVIGGAVDSQNDTYVGWSTRDSDDTASLILFKYNSSDQLQWYRNIKFDQYVLSTSGYVETKVHVTITNQNRLYAMFSVIPVNTPSAVNTAIHFLEISIADGSVLSHNDFSLPPNAVLRPGPKTAATDSQGRIYIAGQYQATLNENDPSSLILAKYDVNGGLIWLKQIPNDAGFKNFANGIATTFDSEIEYLYISGSSIRQSDNRRFSFISKLDTNGNVIWAYRYGVANTSTQITSLNSLASDPLSGYLVATGSTQNSAAAFWFNQSTGSLEYGWNFVGNPDPTVPMVDLGLVNDSRGFSYFSFLQACDTSLRALMITAKFMQEKDFTQTSYSIVYSGENISIQPARVPAGYFISKNTLAWTASAFSANLNLFNVASNTASSYTPINGFNDGVSIQTQQV